MLGRQSGKVGRTALAVGLAILLSAPVLAFTPALTPALTPASALASLPPQNVRSAAPGPTSTQKVLPKPVKRPHRTKPHTGKTVVATTPVVESQPLAPQKPDWPINDAAVPASVGWNGQDLMIAAANASLHQILHDVSTATGLKLEGLAVGPGSQGDQRIFGSYGPAPALEVLSQLLDGSDYNVLMVGDQWEGAPRELVLTAKARGVKANSPALPGNAQQNQSADEEAPEDPEPPEQPDLNLRRPPSIPPSQPGQPGPGVRTPQQMLQDMQQRQQQLQNGQTPNN